MSTHFTGKRKPAVAGQFYPEDPAQLRNTVERFLQVAPPRLPGALRALILPHAGYSYSGGAAGQGYALLRQGRGIERVVVAAPSHQMGFNGISLGDYAAFSTPLGDVSVDAALCAELAAAHPLISCSREPHVGEHALEVQLPFLQLLLPEARLVPLVCGQLSRADLRGLADALRGPLWNPQTLWVISSDFTHYGESFGYVPFTRDVPRRLEELDAGAIEFIERLELDGFTSYVERTGATICGSVPISLLLAVAEPEKERLGSRLLAYTTSGRLTHDWENTVSYVAIAVHDAGTTESAPGATDAEASLNDDDKRILLRLARETIASSLARRQLARPPLDCLSPVLQAHGAAFVTLNLRGQLRGCIGCLEAIEPLYETIINNARNAAFHDPRFFPVTAAELEAIEIEISVLTPPRDISALDEFVLGRHGIILDKDGASAVFLPQVPGEQGWDKETTLRHLALKAGLASDGWRRGASFAVFEAIVFGEKTRPPDAVATAG